MAEDKKKEGAKQAKPAAPAVAAGKGGGNKATGQKGRSADKGSKSETAPGPAIKRIAPPRLKTVYGKEVIARLQKEFGFKNVNQVPKLVKITINMGLGEAIGNPKVIDSAVEELRLISGQSPVVTKAKKSIATFKLREGQKIGAMVTLRNERMWEFFDRLVTLALPRVRDFKVFPRVRSMAVVTSRSAFASRSSSPRSTTTRSTRSRALTFPS